MLEEIFDKKRNWRVNSMSYRLVSILNWLLQLEDFNGIFKASNKLRKNLGNYDFILDFNVP